MARRQPGLSERHRKIMEFLTKFQDTHGYSPSIRQIGDSINVKSTSLVDYYLKQLQDMAYIEREDRISRSIRVLQPVQPGTTLPARVSEAFKSAGSALAGMVSIPIAGRIVASEPIPMPVSDLNYYDAESSVDIARSLLPAKDINDLFALEVSGDSMIDAMINDGDIVVMKPANEARNGEMVAVWLPNNNEATLKYFFKEKDRYRLQPANPTMKAIYIKKTEPLEIKGKVVMVIRRMEKPLAA